MKIVILGAGQVGSTLAENLSTEANDISVIDIRKECLKELQDRLDIQTIQGHAAYPHILRQAGGEDADMIVAVTGDDEVNMVACQTAWTLFRIPSKIGRIRAVEYQTEEKLFNDEAIPIDVLINPEQVVTEHISRLIKHPGALQVLNFADKQVQLVAMKAAHSGHLVGRELHCLRQLLPSVDTRVAAIFRQNQPIVPKGSTMIESDDEIFFIAARDDIQAVMREIRGDVAPYKRVFIAGGGHIGESLARAIEKNYRVKVIERNYSRCQTLSEILDKTLVVHGEASDQGLLLEENIEDTDVFCALTNDDEANIMTAMLAKRLGARKVMALINNRAYVDLVQGGEIDIAI